MISTIFYNKQEDLNKDAYIKLLQVTGALSNLFSNSKCPCIYYRAMENVFCKAFNAKNLSRSDLSIDASKDKIGIGLKTFLHNNGKTFQKIAEFDNKSINIRSLNAYDLVRKVSVLRNKRLDATKRICNTNELIYHLLTRSPHYFSVFEENMDFIDTEKIHDIRENKNSVSFCDGINEYSFNKSKSTLLKRFNTGKCICKFEVKIMTDPFEFLLKSIEKPLFTYEEKQLAEDYIILPLYSPKTNRVEVKSGLNQWNARGRKRNPNEVYIPIPAWIHNKKKNFFKYNTEDHKTQSFKVVLPNDKTLNMKVAQEGGKALMSDPNKDLGEWILREVLDIQPNVLVTKEDLDTIGIDGVKLSKIDNENYSLDFTKTGSYADFEHNFNK